jgi:hypothetical protein
MTGIKSFADPHPTDASKIIRYVSLEGPESGTYFRGKARFQGGLATIEVPEDFRMVTDSDGLSIQVTPIGQMSTVAVLRIGLDQIVVQGSRDVKFLPLLNGVWKPESTKPLLNEGDTALLGMRKGVTTLTPSGGCREHHGHVWKARGWLLSLVAAAPVELPNLPHPI